MANHILSKGSVDTTLSRDSVASRREELGDTGSVEPGFRKTESGTQPGTTSTDDNGIILVILAIGCKNYRWRNRHGQLTITGYFSEMYPSAALARSGWLPKMRAGNGLATRESSAVPMHTSRTGGGEETSLIQGAGDLDIWLACATEEIH